LSTEGKEAVGSEKLLLRTLVIVPLLLAVGFFTYVGFQYARSSTDWLPKLDVGQAAPDFTFPDLQGRGVTLSSLRGKVVLLNIWATWCPTCIEEMPSLQRLHEAFREKDFRVVSVSIDVLGAQVVEPFMRKYRLDFPALLDPRGTIKQTYATTGVPETFIITREGVLARKVIGPRDWMDPNMVTFIRQLVEKG
jgi:peroxiredoxin